MTGAFGASDGQGAWLWKDAYEAAEATLVLFLQRYGRAMRREAGTGLGGPAAMLAMLETLAALEPSQTRRSEEQIALQQFSTPLPLAYAALQAAAIRPGDVVLEPSAGTGMLAVMAACALGKQAGGSLLLNEIAATRAGLLSGMFPAASVTRHNAEAIADYLPALRPTVVLMNPPFSASPGVDRIRHHADLRHIRSAFSMLPPGGRLVVAHCVASAFHRSFHRPATFTTAIDGRPTRAAPPSTPGSPCSMIDVLLIARLPIEPLPGADLFGHAPTRRVPRRAGGHGPPHMHPAVVSQLGHRSPTRPAGHVRFHRGRPPAPTSLRAPSASQARSSIPRRWQSGAMAAVPHPAPSYHPMLPNRDRPALRRPARRPRRQRTSAISPRSTASAPAGRRFIASTARAMRMVAPSCRHR